MTKTNNQFDQAFLLCRGLFEKKLQDYGASWRIMRPESLTDQIYIKANRIRSLEIKKESLVGEGITEEFVAIVNYGIIGLIQLQLGFADTSDMEPETVMKHYNEQMEAVKNLMICKNHDYGEAWRMMRVSSFTDLILMKIYRTKEIENNQGNTLVSEGVDANYMDMINYAIFGIIKLELEEEAYER